MKLHRIYTENKNKNEIVAFAGSFFDSYSAFEGEGLWYRQSEPCLMIEIIGDEQVRDKVLQLAEAIKRINQQESVLVTEQNIERTTFV